MKPKNMRPERPDAGTSPVLHSSAVRQAEVLLSPDSAPPNSQPSTLSPQPLFPPETILDAAGRYLERVEDDDLDLMSFADACKALEVASRIGQQAASSETDDPTASTRTLRDQLATLLDQAYSEAPSQAGAADQPKPAPPTRESPDSPPITALCPGRIPRRLQPATCGLPPVSSRRPHFSI